MTKLLEKAITEIRRLPEERQDELAEIMLEIAAHGSDDHRLTAEQLADLDARLSSPPDYANDEETAALLERLTK